MNRGSSITQPEIVEDRSALVARSAEWKVKLHWTVFALFLCAAVLVWIELIAPHPFAVTAGWSESFLLLLAAGTTIASLCRELPGQNVFLAATLIALVTGLTHLVNGLAALPFGPVVYHPENIGPFLGPSLPWVVPILWVVIVLNARGVARLVLRPMRSNRNYGLWVMSAAIALLLLFELGFEPFATQVKAYWTWKPTQLPVRWYETPWTNFLGIALMSLLLLLLITPALIDKHPSPKPPALHPLLVWQVLSAMVLSAALRTGLWAAAALTLAQMLIVASLALAGTPPNKTIRAAGLS